MLSRLKTTGKSTKRGFQCTFKHRCSTLDVVECILRIDLGQLNTFNSQRAQIRWPFCIFTKPIGRLPPQENAAHQNGLNIYELVPEFVNTFHLRRNSFHHFLLIFLWREKFTSLNMLMKLHSRGLSKTNLISITLREIIHTFMTLLSILYH